MWLVVILYQEPLLRAGHISSSNGVRASNKQQYRLEEMVSPTLTLIPAAFKAACSLSTASLTDALSVSFLTMGTMTTCNTEGTGLSHINPLLADVQQVAASFTFSTPVLRGTSKGCAEQEQEQFLGTTAALLAHEHMHQQSQLVLRHATEPASPHSQSCFTFSSKETPQEQTCKSCNSINCI